MSKVLVYNARLIDAFNDIADGALLFEDGKISDLPDAAAVKELLKDEGLSKYDAKGCVVMPSFIDTHAHFRDPGLTQKEDICTGASAAAAGGFGTVVLMPNTSPVLSSQAMAVENNAKCAATGLCRSFQTVSITKDFDGKTISHLEELDSSKVPVITEDGKEVCDSSVMSDAMKIAAKKGIIVACHCEDPFLAAKARPYRKTALDILAKGQMSEKEKNTAVEALRTADQILAQAEDAATYRNVRLAKDAGCHIHLCHVSTKECVDIAKKAKKEGQKVTFEITPHHIGFESGNAPEIFNIVNPPLRTAQDREALIQALLNGDADCIGTDHAPHTAEDKKNGSPGFSGIETAFATCNTVLVKERGMDLKFLSSLMSYRPAQILGLNDTALIKTGYRADFVVVDPDENWTVKGQSFKSKGKFTPLEGKTLTGKVKATFFNGTLVYQG